MFKQLVPSKWDFDQLKRVISKINNKKILVIGDVGLDRYTIGSVERVSDEAPVPIVYVKEEVYKLGLAANVADNIRALGGTPFLAGAVGSDRVATDLKSVLRKFKISPEYLIVDKARRTILKERVIGQRQQIVRVDYETIQNMDKALENKFIIKIKSILKNVDAVIIEDYAKGLLSEGLIKNVVKLAKSKKLWVAVDPNLLTPANVYKGVDLLTPNKKEAEQLAGMRITNDKSLLQAASKIFKLTQTKALIVTLGADGMAIFTSLKQQPIWIPADEKEVFDVSGAGDTVISVLALAICAGAKLEEAALLANIAGGIEVGKKGTATVSREEIEFSLSEIERLV